MYKKRPVIYDASKGYITISIDSGFITSGVYKIKITDGDKMITVGEGNFDDNIKDIFLIPINPAVLEDWMLIIIADYAPAAGHTQISVNYNFLQQGAQFDAEPIRENKVALAAHHDFTFQKK